jgi:hypothetical protein
VFVAVTWSLLGLTGRTLVLVGVTALLAAGATLVTRRGLRGAAETFWIVVSGMLVVDLLGAQSADLAGLGRLDWRGTALLVGIALLALGLGVGLWARTTKIDRLVGAELVAGAGALVVVSSNAWSAVNVSVGCAVAVPVLAVLFVALRREISIAAYAMGGLGLLTWVVLLTAGVDRAGEYVSVSAWWSDLRGWPLVVAAAYAAVPVHAPKVPEWARTATATGSLVALAVLANAPLSGGTPERQLVAVSLVLAALGVAAATAPRHWALGAGFLAAMGVTGAGFGLASAPWDAVSGLSPDGGSPVDLVVTGAAGGPAPWTGVVLALATAVALVCLVRLVPAAQRAAAASTAGALVAAVLAAGALGLVLDLEPPLWTAVLTAAVAAGAVGTMIGWAHRELIATVVAIAATAYFALLTLWTAAANDLLMAIATTVLCAVLAAVHAVLERVGDALSAAVTAPLAALAGAWALTSWGVRLGLEDTTVTIVLAMYAVSLGLLADPMTRRPSSRAALESTALIVGLMCVAYTEQVRTEAMALTIVGSAVCAVAVLHRDRDMFSWVGAAILGLATVLRVAVDVPAPELYTLPAAAFLLVAGAWRLRSDTDASSFGSLGSGLTLALLPSLLLALDEPVSLRGALVAASGVCVLVLGLADRLGAPFLAGALVTAVLAVRHLEPYADAVPRWVSLGTVGLALLLVGVTWESRKRNLEAAGRYLAALR